MSLTLRPATAADAPRIAEVYLRSFHDLIPTVKLAHTDDQVRAWIRDHVVPSGHVTVAERNGEIVGMMSTESGEEHSWIHHLYIHPKEIRKGVGTALLKRAQELLPPPIRLYTFQSNQTARHFYEHHNFRAIQFGDGSTNEENAPDILLEWTKRPEKDAPR